MMSANKIIIALSIVLCSFSTSGFCNETYTFPVELLATPDFLSRYNFGEHSDTLRGYYAAFSPSTQVDVLWKYRPSTEYTFKTKTQTLTVSYHIIDTWAPSQDLLFIIGVNSSGQTRVEKWQFNHHDIFWTQPLGGGDPVWKRALPSVRRTELYSGTDLTTLSSITGDPQVNSLFLYTWDSKTIYQMNPNTGDYTYLCSPSDHPLIADFKIIHCRDHINEGYLYYFKKWASYEYDRLQPVDTYFDGTSGYTVYANNVIFRDSNRDGIIDPDSLEQISKADWVANGYHLDSSFN